MRAVGRGALASDATDAAFEKAFARWDRVQVMRSPNGWIYRVAVNEARAQLRRESREAERASFAVSAAPVPPPGGETWLLVATLPPRQRMAVVLRHVAGFTEAEIGSAMGVTRSTVNSTLASAYTTLRLQLAEPQTKEPLHMSQLELAVVRACDPDGCDVDLVAAGSRRVSYSVAVRDTVKVRPGDLVAVDGDLLVWRWWHGTVVSVSEPGTGERTARIERNVTQRGPGDPRTSTAQVEVPADLAADIAVGDVVYYGTVDGGALTVMATAAAETILDRVAPRLPAIATALG